MKPGPQSLDKEILRQIGTPQKLRQGTFSRLKCSKGNLGTFGAARHQLLCPAIPLSGCIDTAFVQGAGVRHLGTHWSEKGQ